MRTYGKALLALFILLCLSVCGNLSLLVTSTWWMSLRTKVREVGDEAVKAKLEEFDDEVNRLRAQPQAINEAPEDSSEDEDEGTYSSPGEWAPMPLSLALGDR